MERSEDKINHKIRK